MKENIYKPLLLLILMLLLTVPANSQSRKVEVYSTSGENTDCGVYISSYRTFFKLGLYPDAMETWLPGFNKCPSYSEMMYVDGVTMYRSFIESAPEGPARENLIDTLMLIYDRRMENFGGEGNVLGRKGRDLLSYRGEDIEQVQAANTMLRKSIELSGTEARESAMLLCISSGIELYRKELIDTDQLLGDYFMIKDNLFQLEKERKRWEKTTAKVDEMMLKEGLLSCESLESYIRPQMEQKRDDSVFLEFVLSTFTMSGCEKSDIFVTAAENMYTADSSAESAHFAAIQYINRNDLNKAAFYLKEGLKGEDIDTETRAEWFYELAIVNYALQDYCGAIESAREVINLKNDFGKAYILLGDAYIISYSGVSDDFQKRTAYWAAADKYIQAGVMDPSQAERSKEKLALCTSQYPDNEEIFFRDMKVGDSFVIDGCINETTTVRSRK